MENIAEAEFIQGQIEKKNYRKSWLKNAKAHKSHPINFGIHMDTHHLISAEAIVISKLGVNLVNKGYVIDSLNNLVGFPSTLVAACHLKTQLHRGDHIYSRPDEEPYHKYVSSLLKRKKQKIKGCYGRTEKKETEAEIHRLLDPISKDILEEVLDFEIPLTEIFIRFKKGENSLGCSNCFDIKPALENQSACSKDRNHYGEVDKKYQGSTQSWNSNRITYEGTWTPKVGL